MSDIGTAEIALRVLIALLPAVAIGLERELSAQPAGLRTHTLLSLGSCLFALAGIQVSGGDPGRVAAQVASGVGFLGAGAILRESFRIRGLTTAASLWVTASVGVAAGLGAYAAVGAVALAALVTLVALAWVERSFLPVQRGQPIAVAVSGGVELPVTVTRIREVVGRLDVSQIEPTGNGGHRIIGDSHLPAGFDLVEVAERLRTLPGVTAVDLTR